MLRVQTGAGSLSVATAAVSPRATEANSRLASLAFYAGIAAVALPTLLENLHQSWSSEQGQAGPIVLTLGLWLAYRRWPAMRAAGAPGSRLIAITFGLLTASAYLLGRVADQFLLESYALYGLALAVLYGLVGGDGLKKGWFPLAYLILALPAPYTLMWLMTSHLRLWITEGAVRFLHLLGFSIVRDGLDIFVDQYQLAVKEACSGMNSLISLSAIGLVYIHLRRAPPAWYLAASIPLIVVFAVFGNFVRVLILILLTHFFGDAVAQSFLHEGAGIATFLVALCSVIVVDALVAPVLIGGNASPGGTRVRPA